MIPAVVALLAAALTGLAIWLLSPPAPIRRLTPGSDRGRTGRPRIAAGWFRARFTGRWGRRHRPPAPAVGDLADRLAALSRAGLAPKRIWTALAAASSGPNADLARAIAGSVTAGGSSAEALRAAGRTDGWEQVDWLAVAWAVAERAGVPLAPVLERIADACQAEAAAADERGAAIAGPAASATVLSALPLAGIGLGWTMGVNPVVALLTTGAGQVCFLVGVGCWATGRWWVSRLVARAERAGP